jgi:hypothetical protein
MLLLTTDESIHIYSDQVFLKGSNNNTTNDFEKLESKRFRREMMNERFQRQGLKWVNNILLIDSLLSIIT